MNRFVLDCSVTMSWFLQDEPQAATGHILDMLGNRQAMVPPIWTYEVGNVLLVAQKQKRLSAAETATALSHLKSLPIQIADAPDVGNLPALLSISREYQLSLYDAAYLELAIRESIPLATIDRILLTAARKSGVAAL